MEKLLQAGQSCRPACEPGPACLHGAWNATWGTHTRPGRPGRVLQVVWQDVKQKNNKKTKEQVESNKWTSSPQTLQFVGKVTWCVQNRLDKVSAYADLQDMVIVWIQLVDARDVVQDALGST